MDAIALAHALDGSRGSDGAISLRQLQRLLSDRGHEELARAVESLAGHLTPARLKMDLDNVFAPWIV